MIDPRKLLLCLACASACVGRGQQDEPLRWRIGTEVVQDMLLNLNARAYIVTGRWSFGMHGGYRPSATKGGEVKPGPGFIGAYEDLNWRNWLLKAYTIGPCIRRNAKGGIGSFVELDAFYRLWWFDHRWARYNNADDVSFDGQRSERTEVMAVRLLWGTASDPKFKDNRRSANTMEFYGGIGYRWKTRTWTMHSGTYAGNIVTEQQGEKDESMPTVHIGIRFCRVGRARTSVE